MRLRHLQRLYHAFRDYRGFRQICSGRPTRLWLEPTSLCNLHCGFCPNKDLPRADKSTISMELFRKIIDEARPHVHDVNLFHRGESLICRELPEMIRIVKSAGMNARLHTNATLLTAERAVELMDAGLDYISFSFDGYDKESYEAARAGGRYEKSLGNILQFLRLKRERGSRKPYAVLQVMELDGSPKPVRRRKRAAFLAQFRSLPLDRVTIRTPHNWGGNIAFPGAERYNGRRYAPCPFPWYSLTILWNGKVCPCPQDFMGDLPVGDLKQSSLEEIWNGPALRTLRGRLKRRDIPAHWPCATCDRLYRKRFLGLPTDYLLPFLRDNLLAPLAVRGARCAVRRRKPKAKEYAPG